MSTATTTPMSDDVLVLVTGATGFLASHVIQQLQYAGYRVRGTVRDLTETVRCQALRDLCPGAAHPIELVQADLLQAADWFPAVTSCEYILYLATPCYSKDNPGAVVPQTVEGVVNVLRAARATPSVKRVVMASSLTAIQGGLVGEHGRTYSSSDWVATDQSTEPAIGGKAAAEEAAWRFVQGLPSDEHSFELSVINAGFLLGPLLTNIHKNMFDIVATMMNRKMPCMPRICLAFADVRDVARAHVVAMTLPEASGKRYLVHGGNLWLRDMAVILSDQYKSRGYRIATRDAPDCLVWMASWFDGMAKMIHRSLKKECYYDTKPMVTELEVKPHPVTSSVLDMAQSLIEHGMVTPTETGCRHGQGKTTPAVLVKV